MIFFQQYLSRAGAAIGWIDLLTEWFVAKELDVQGILPLLDISQYGLPGFIRKRKMGDQRVFLQVHRGIRNGLLCVFVRNVEAERIRFVRHGCIARGDDDLGVTGSSPCQRQEQDRQYGSQACHFNHKSAFKASLILSSVGLGASGLTSFPSRP